MADSFTYPGDAAILDGLVLQMESIRAGANWLAPLPPTKEQLRHLLDSCFAASLETEENRAVSFALSFLDVRKHQPPYYLDKAISLSAKQLTRLSAALDPSRSCICVAAEEHALGAEWMPASLSKVYCPSEPSTIVRDARFHAGEQLRLKHKSSPSKVDIPTPKAKISGTPEAIIQNYPASLAWLAHSLLQQMA